MTPPPKNNGFEIQLQHGSDSFENAYRELKFKCESPQRDCAT